LFKFATACADAAMDSGSFGTRFQCWAAMSLASTDVISSADWLLFRARSRSGAPSLLCHLPLGSALRRNHHEHVISGHNLMRAFKPRSSFFVSHSWGDGTREFITRLKKHLEEQTLASVWVDMEGLNQQQEVLIPAFREALCQARVVIVVLTPSYLTRPNCLRELRWALDFERAGYLRVVLLSVHPAVTFGARQQLVQDGRLQGLVFSCKEKKVKRLCPEALALVKRLNDVHMNMLPWHELQAWRSDDEKVDWEEQRQYTEAGADKTVSLAGGPQGLVELTVDVVKDFLVCASPRPVSECATMDDTDALLASDVTSADDACSVLDVSRYPEAGAAELKSEMEEVIRRRAPAPAPQPAPAPVAVLLPLDDLRSLSSQAIGDEISAIAPDYVAYSALFVSAGFDGTLLCDVDDSELPQLVQDVGIGNSIHRRRVVAQLRVVRSRYGMQP
jgi:hypothetical protein